MATSSDRAAATPAPAAVPADAAEPQAAAPDLRPAPAPPESTAALPLAGTVRTPPLRPIGATSDPPGPQPEADAPAMTAASAAVPEARADHAPRQAAAPGVIRDDATQPAPVRADTPTAAPSGPPAPRVETPHTAAPREALPREGAQTAAPTALAGSVAQDPPQPAPAPAPAAPRASAEGVAPAPAGPVVASTGLPLIEPGGNGPLWRLSAEPIAASRAPAPMVPATSTPPQVVVGQVAAAARAGESDRIEVRLDPPELGRVQIEMRVADKALHAVVLAERPEVQDLLRRHGEQLQRELEAAGYEGVRLDFAAGRDDRGDAAPSPTLAGAGAAEPTAAPAAPTRRPTGDGRLDIRL